MSMEVERPALGWPNLAKAGCILLVVMMHCADQMADLPWRHKDQLWEVWRSINAFIRPIRMPLFFLVSGLLASDSIVRPRWDTGRKRLMRPLYLYLLWAVIYSIALQGPWQSEDLAAGLAQRSTWIMSIGSPSWYMISLAIYFALAKLTLHIRPLPVLLICAILSALATVIAPYLPGQQHKILRCVIFFVGGVRLKEGILAFVQAATPRRAAVLLAAYAAGAAACVPSDTFLLPVDVMAVAAGAALCGVLAKRLHRVAEPASWLAQRTLPIYLIHLLLLPVAARLLEWSAPAILGSYWLGFLYPVLATPVIAACSLLAYSLMYRCGATWMFDLPSPRRPPTPVQLQAA